jgi:hypothetical protein
VKAVVREFRNAIRSAPHSGGTKERSRGDRPARGDNGHHSPAK